MTKSHPTTVTPPSVKAQLKNIADKNGMDYQRVAQAYCSESLMRRIGLSVHNNKYILKGGMMLRAWVNDWIRSTQDIDLSGDPHINAYEIKTQFKEIASITVNDALQINPETVQVQSIKAQTEERGLRITMQANLGKETYKLQVDIGLGNDINPDPQFGTYPAILQKVAPAKLHMYPKETAIAEKVAAMIELGFDNSRVKDVFDVIILAKACMFDGKQLCTSMKTTFAKRGTPPTFDLPQYNEDFWDTPHKNIWKKLNRDVVDKHKVENPISTIPYLKEFLQPVLNAVEADKPLNKRWSYSDKWH